MSLSGREIRRIARLARLELSPREEELYAGQLAEVVSYIDQLGRWELETPEEPRSAPVEREDAPGEMRLDLAEWRENAPASLDRFVLVPQVKKSD